ncbi:MAG: Regulator of chromosome condensation repeat, partial [Myxococcales bacterium]|nr:Regulator of chromosome condensation repeat [Myxococcales bacterium]
TPRAVSGVQSAVQVAVGLHHACAVVESGAVWCWGQASFGAVGTIASGFAADPVAVVWR